MYPVLCTKYLIPRCYQMIDETEITVEIRKELNELLNSPIKTPEKARVVAGRLLRRGIQPTWRLIREILGTGSATTLQKAVNQYWDELGGYLDKLEKRPELPETLVTEFNKIWDNALQLAEKEAQNHLKEDFDKVKAIEDKIHEENKRLKENLKEEYSLKTEAELQLQQLKTAYQAQQAELDQSKQWQQSLKTTIEENKKEFSDGLQAQQQTYAEKHTQLQQTYGVLEQSLKQTAQQLVTSKSQQALSDKKNQHIINELKQDRQRELDRQAKQYDSMLEHYSNEIGQLKVKLEATEKQQNKNNKNLQRQHESNLITMTELQTNLAALSQTTQQLEKKNTDKSRKIETQSIELQQLNKDYAMLEARFGVLTMDK